MVARTCTLVAVIALASPVWADSAALEREAESMAAGDDFVGAAAKYRAAYREDPRPDLLCNVGVAYYKAKDLPRSHRYLDQCVTSGGSLDPAFITNVKAVLTAVEDKLRLGDFKPLNFIVQPPAATTTFAGGTHDEPLVGSRQVWVPYGSYRVTIHAEGFTDRVLEVTASDRERGEYSIKLEPAAKRAEPQPQLPLEPARPLERPSLIAPITASAITGVLGGVAIGFYIAARGSAADANKESVSLADYERHSDDATTRKYIALGVGGLAGVAAITAGVLWWRASKARSRVEVSATASSVLLIGRW